MLIISYIFLFIASILLFWLMNISQIGPNWEIPVKIFQKGNFATVVSTLFTVLSFLLVFVSKEKYSKLGFFEKNLHIVWCLIIILILILGWSKLVYQIPAVSPILSSIFKNMFIPGIIASIVVLFSLIFITKKY